MNCILIQRAGLGVLESSKQTVRVKVRSKCQSYTGINVDLIQRQSLRLPLLLSHTGRSQLLESVSWDSCFFPFQQKTALQDLILLGPRVSKQLLADQVG